MSDALGPVVITAREIYDQQVRLIEAVSRLVDGLEGLRQDLRDHDAAQQQINRDHEDRLRALERARWPLPSLSVLVALAALAVAYFKK